MFRGSGPKIFIFGIILVLASCVPEKGKDKAECGSSEAFNSTSRKCYSVSAPRSAPSPSTVTASINEDSGTNAINISYTDTEADYATSCNVISASSTLDGSGLVPASCSCVGGVCTLYINPDLNFNGTGQVIYNLSDDDGTSANKTIRVTVNAVDDAPVNLGSVPASPVTINEDTIQSFTFNYSDAENDIASACQIVLTSNLTTTTACSCTAFGICSFALSGSSNYNGIGQNFQYRIYAGGQWSSYSTVFVDISSVNDTPTLAAGTQTVTLLEDGPGAPGDIIVTAGTDPDILTNGDILNYTAVTAVTHGVLSNCLGGTSDRDCYYAPTADKNDQNIYANCLYGSDIRFVSKTAAQADGLVTVTFTDDPASVTLALSYVPIVSVVGNAITIKINNTNTTGDQVAAAVAASASAAALVDVYLLAARGVTAASTGVDGNGNATAAGACPLAGSYGSVYDTFTYKATDTLGPTDAATIRTATINITAVNDAPTDGADFLASSTLASEDTTFNFTINGTISEVDLKDSITCSYNSGSSSLRSGTLTNCLGLTGSVGNCDLTCTFVPALNDATDAVYTDDGDEVVVAFTYSDGTATSAVITTVEFDIAPVNDAPTICNYSTYKQAPECGLTGCIDNKTPIGNILPASHVTGTPLYYFDSSAAVCYMSTGSATTSDWSVTTASFINNYTINEKQTLYIDKIRVDEGGGDTTENSEEVRWSITSSSNPVLIPTANIKLYFDQNDNKVISASTEEITAAYGEDFETGAADDSGLRKMRIAITPQGVEVGTSTITLAFRDNNVVPATTSVAFTVTVNPVSANHNGWKNIQALGPKMDKFGQYRSATDAVVNNYVCNYNRAKCNNKQPCKGTSAPAGVVFGDVKNVLYYDATGAQCYIYTGDGTTTVQTMSYRPKAAGVYTLVYTDDGSVTAAGNETVSVSGTTLTVKIKSGVSSSTDVYNAIQDSSAAVAVMTVTDNTPGTLQVTTGSPFTLTDISNSALWTTFNTVCNISDSDIATECSTLGGNCIGTTAEYTALAGTVPTGLDHYYYNSETAICNRSINITADLDTIDGGAATLYSQTSTSEVTLEWEAFDIVGSGSISGYNVYRRPAFNITDLKVYDYEWPINQVTLASTATSYTDNITNSWQPPVSGTVYYYEVRPIIDSVETSTNEAINSVRIIAPNPNMAFAHRWVINRNMCELMGRSLTASPPTIDASLNYRCANDGWDDAGSTSGYYDVGGDYYVPRFEFGCPYSGTPACTWTTDGSCIGITTAGANTAAIGTVYYDRSTAICYVNTDGAATWTNLNSAAGAALNTANTQLITGNKYMSAILPPITNISGTHAQYFCADPAVAGVGMGNTHTSALSTAKYMVTGLAGALTYKLPTRKDQIALSQWHPDTSDSTAKTIEEGLSLNSSPKCNASSASGLTSGYTNADFPASSVAYSLPGTLTSGIRSMATGTYYTGSCVSRYGIQDLIGNVAEWTQNYYACGVGLGLGTVYECILSVYSSNDGSAFAGGVPIKIESSTTPLLYEINSNAYDGTAVGPVNDTDADGDSDSNFSSTITTLADELYGVGYLNLSYGLPVNNTWVADATFVGTVATDHTLLLAGGLAEIGPSSGITSDQLRGDSVTYNSVLSTNEIVSGGGDWNDGTGAGLWNYLMTPLETTNNTYTGFRCIAPIPSASYVE